MVSPHSPLVFGQQNRPGSSSVRVCHMQDGFPDKRPVEELAYHLTNMRPGGFHADGRFDLAGGNQASQMRQPDGGRFQRQFLKQDEAI